MKDDPNAIIKERLKNIEDRIARLSFLKAHLFSFKEDIVKIDEPIRVFEGISLFYYYSLSQFILEINKLFSQDPWEYYSIPKLINHIDSNIKYVIWHKQKLTFQEITKEQYKLGELIWSGGEKTEWFEVATGDDLNKVKKIIKSQNEAIEQNKEIIEQVKLARDKVIAHLDKDFQKYNIKIPLESVAKLLNLAFNIFNVLNLEINGSSMHVESKAISSIKPIEKFNKIQRLIIEKKRARVENISIEELRDILK